MVWFMQSNRIAEISLRTMYIFYGFYDFDNPIPIINYFDR